MTLGAFLSGGIDSSVSVALASKIPPGTCKISESGIKNSSDISMLIVAGYQGFLVGETLVTSDDPGRALRELLSFKE